MVDHCDVLLAIWDGKKSGGVWSTIRKAQKAGKQIVYCPKEVLEGLYVKTIENKEELENLIIKDIDKIVLYTTIKDVKTGEESEIQIDITNCHDAAITIDKWEELNIKK